MQSETKKKKSSNDVMLLDKIIDLNLLFEKNLMRIDTILDNSESVRKFSLNIKHKAFKKRNKSTKKQKKSTKKTNNRISDFSKKDFEAPLNHH
ncbi:hypothetical protein AYI68_g3946 [Smittium mucronatum]|uniref:Uncharacterized protein n=1 Tax=Smittium mucronatum TaxID=133383 RepID=A0A1R0GYF5_9FUNG|nr:hypothetical protein AYI68_g3946 [Smittium mucronatum]